MSFFKCNWAVLAEYGSAWLETGDETAAVAQLTAIWDNFQFTRVSSKCSGRKKSNLG
jgi:hypothetical protein